MEMPDQPLKLTIVTQHLDCGARLAEALRFAEIRCCGEGTEDSSLRKLVRELTEAAGAMDWPRRVIGGEPQLQRIMINIDPPRNSAAWIEQARVEFHVVAWRHGEEAHLAYVPALGIEIVAPSAAALEKAIPQHIRFALQRTKAASSLYRLSLLQSVENVSLQQSEIDVSLKTPRQREVDEAKEQEDEDQKLLIERVGRVLQEDALPPAYEVEPLVRQIADALSGRNPRSVLLVGPSGVGKTAAVYELVRRRQSLQLGATPFWTTSGSRLVAGMSGFGMWQERCQRLCQQASHCRAIVHFGGLMELLEVGRSEWVGQGIASFLRPYLGRGELLAIAECTAEQLVLIERQDPHLLNVFQQIRVDGPSIERGRMILLSHAIAAGAEKKAAIDEAALETLDRLHRRYAGYSAYPGRPLRFLSNLLDDAPAGSVVDSAQVTAGFSRQTGLPLFMLDDRHPLKLDEARRWFARRVIGQDEAADLVVDVLATVKAGMNRPRRPIASLLFIGPTGVGKTEMAKSLAEFLFSDKARITRFDMSEYGTEADVQRLVGGSWQAEGLLTAKVREQPFSVVLLDEFEKAHPSFFDLLLQILGEARLTDAAGRVADFSNAVAVMTSNLGAESFQSGVFGLSRDGQRDARSHFVEEVRRNLRPELFNRIDRIVPFVPLGREAVVQIARRELDLIARRDGIRLRDVRIRYAADVVEHLASRGYDRQYGARPLKRLIERELLVPLSDGMNMHGERMPLDADVSLGDGTLKITVRGRAEPRSAAPTPAALCLDLAHRAQDCRRLMQAVLRSPSWMSIQNELFTLNRAQLRAGRRAKQSGRPLPFDRLLHEQLQRLTEISGAVKSLNDRATAIEDRALSAVHRSTGSDAGVLDADINAIGRDIDRLLLELYVMRYPDAHCVLVAIWSDHQPSLLRLAEAYLAAASPAGKITAAWFSRHSASALRRNHLRRPRELSLPNEGVLGIAMTIHDQFAQPRYGSEAGTHTFLERGNTRSCFVEIGDANLAAYVPPEAIVQRRKPQPAPQRRSYNLDQGTAEDAVLGRELRWSGRKFNDVIREALELQLRMAVRAQVEP